MISKLQAKSEAKQTKPSSSVGDEKHISEDSPLPGKRRRNQPGEWWISSMKDPEKKEVGDRPFILNKSKQNRRQSKALSAVKARHNVDLTEGDKKQSLPASMKTTRQKAKKKTPKPSKDQEKQRGIPSGTINVDRDIHAVVAKQILDQEDELQVPGQSEDPGQISPMDLSSKQQSHISGNKSCDITYVHTSSIKRSSMPTPATMITGSAHVKSSVSEKRRRRPVSNWWMVSDRPEDTMSLFSDSPSLNPNYHKIHEMGRKQSKSQKSFALATSKNDNLVVSEEGAAQKLKSVNSPNTVQCSMHRFNDIFPNATETLVSSHGNVYQENRLKMLFPVIEETSEKRGHIRNYPTKHRVQEPAADVICPNAARNTMVTMDYAEESENTRGMLSETRQGKRQLSENTGKSFRSGPNSMVELGDIEMHGNSPLLCKDVPPVQSFLELCGHPLKPMLLQEDDMNNLKCWFKLLWPSKTKNYGITPDCFNWYSYKGKVMGMQVDIHCSPFCIGKMLLGSYMKKPLCVDHSATTVFTLGMGSVNFTVDGNESYHEAGEVFMVPCGHAYSVENVIDEPAVLYFSRMRGESLD